VGMKSTASVSAILLSLTACGGGGGGPQVPVPANPPVLPLFDPGQAGTAQNILVVGVDNGNGVVQRQAATLTGSAISGSLLAGTVDVAGQRLTLAGGGSGQLITSAGIDQSFGFSTATHFGVAGAPSAAIPQTGIANYAGNLSAFIDDGVTPETLTGAVMVAADFQNNVVDVSAASINSANHAGSLNIDNATINGTGIFGGLLTLTGNFTSLPTNSGLTHAGQFFGPDGAEVGGAFLLDQMGNGNRIRITGSYAGK